MQCAVEHITMPDKCASHILNLFACASTINWFPFGIENICRLASGRCFNVKRSQLFPFFQLFLLLLSAFGFGQRSAASDGKSACMHFDPQTHFLGCQKLPRLLYISYKVLGNIIALVTGRIDKWGADHIVWQTDGPDKPTTTIVWQTDGSLGTSRHIVWQTGGPDKPIAILCDRRTDSPGAELPDYARVFYCSLVQFICFVCTVPFVFLLALLFYMKFLSHLSLLSQAAIGACKTFLLFPTILLSNLPLDFSVLRGGLLNFTTRFLLFSSQDIHCVWPWWNNGISTEDARPVAASLCCANDILLFFRLHWPDLHSDLGQQDGVLLGVWMVYFFFLGLSLTVSSSPSRGNR